LPTKYFSRTSDGQIIEFKGDPYENENSILEFDSLIKNKLAKKKDIFWSSSFKIPAKIKSYDDPFYLDLEK